MFPAGTDARSEAAAATAGSWLDEVYEAVADAGRWPTALGLLAGELAARCALLEVVEFPSGARLLAASAVAATRPLGAVSLAVAPGGEAGPTGLSLWFEGRRAAARFTVHGTRWVARLALERAQRARPWSEDDRPTMSAAARHLERALRLTVRAGARAALRSPAAAPACPSGPSEELRREIEASLCSDHGLTPGQARVAASFVFGASSAQVADRLGIGIETVRTHLKRIYQKLGTTRQGELVHLLVTLHHLPLSPRHRED